MTKRTFRGSGKSAAMKAVVAGVMITGTAEAGTIDPWQFAAFGTSAGSRAVFITNAKVNGMVGAAGSVSVESAAISGAGKITIAAGGDVSVREAEIDGQTWAGGGGAFDRAYVQGDVVLGGALSGRDTTINGSVSTRQDTSNISITGGLIERAMAGPGVSETAAYFGAMNGALRAAQANGKYENQWGALSVWVHSGLNIVDITAAALDEAWGISVTGAADATLVLRVAGKTAKLDSLQWQYTGGVTGARVLVNYFEATRLELTGGQAANIFAPLAEINVANGAIEGSLIGSTVAVSGSLYGREFTGKTDLPMIPSPASWVAVAGAGAMTGRRRREVERCARS